MTAPTTYEIGTALNAMQTLTGEREPQSEFQDYSGRVRLGSGIVRGVGLPVVSWRYGFLSDDNFDFFKSYCSGEGVAVYIATRDNSRTFRRYLCNMQMPEKYVIRNDKYIDTTFIFTNLVEQVEA